jgi:hypothetical protein
VSWYLDETCVKVAVHWRYLYRAIDRDGRYSPEGLGVLSETPSDEG